MSTTAFWLLFISTCNQFPTFSGEKPANDSDENKSFFRPYSSISSGPTTNPVQAYPDLLRLLLMQCRNNGTDPALMLQILQIHQNLNKLANKPAGSTEGGESTESLESTVESNEDSKNESSNGAPDADDQSTG